MPWFEKARGPWATRARGVTDASGLVEAVLQLPRLVTGKGAAPLRQLSTAARLRLYAAAQPIVAERLLMTDFPEVTRVRCAILRALRWPSLPDWAVQDGVATGPWHGKPPHGTCCSGQPRPCLGARSWAVTSSPRGAPEVPLTSTAPAPDTNLYEFLAAYIAFHKRRGTISEAS